MRDLLAQILREQGYDVAVAGSAREARALDEQLGRPRHRRRHAGDRRRQARARRSTRAHVLFISGYDQQALVETDAAFLQKPFGRDDLSRTVRDLFDGDRARAVLAT